jgi:hypothetical protein
MHMPNNTDGWQQAESFCLIKEHVWYACAVQVSVVLVLIEYQRQQYKEAAKKKLEHQEKIGIMENARLEREVSVPGCLLAGYYQAGRSVNLTHWPGCVLQRTIYQSPSVTHLEVMWYVWHAQGYHQASD